MIRSSLVAMLAICAVCSFCGKDFVTLGRHSWRCKEKINQDRPANTVNQICRLCILLSESQTLTT